MIYLAIVLLVSAPLITPAIWIVGVLWTDWRRSVRMRALTAEYHADDGPTEGSR